MFCGLYVAHGDVLRLGRLRAHRHAVDVRGDVQLALTAPDANLGAVDEDVRHEHVDQRRVEALAQHLEELADARGVLP